MNGSTLPEDFWSRLDERFKDVHAKMDNIYGKVANIDANGCAQRSNDIRRMDLFESWKERTTNKFIGLLLSVIGSLIMALYAIFRH